MQNTTKQLIEYFNISEDTILNVGICGASTQYEIGELLEISNITYKSSIYRLNQREAKCIVCLDEASTQERYEIVDMESYGFYKAVQGIENAYMFKVVSDHFEPERVTKQSAKMILFKNIEKIIKKVSR